MTDPTDPADLPPCGLLRRLAVCFYDALLLFGVLFVATLIAVAANDGEPIPPQHPLMTTFLFFVAFFYFGYFWTRWGQTLGMKAWKVRVTDRRGGPISWWQALLRFLVALASWGLVGLGFLWALVDRERRTWHDLYSETRLVVEQRPLK